MSFAVGTIQVAASAAKILTQADQAGSSLVLFNNGPNTIYLGVDGTVTAANGFPVPAGASLTIDHSHSAGTDIWAIASALQVSPADTRFLVEG